VVNRLAQHFHVVCAELRGYGDSVGPIDCGHCVPEEVPDAVLEAFMRHFKG
jgi:hypothetical protein